MQSIHSNRNLNNGLELHPDYKNWESFLTDYTKLVIDKLGWKVYNSSNHWYMVDSEGFIYLSYGYHIWTLFSELTGINITETRKLFDSVAY